MQHVTSGVSSITYKGSGVYEWKHTHTIVTSR